MSYGDQEVSFDQRGTPPRRPSWLFLLMGAFLIFMLLRSCASSLRQPGGPGETEEIDWTGQHQRPAAGDVNPTPGRRPGVGSQDRQDWSLEEVETKGSATGTHGEVTLQVPPQKSDSPPQSPKDSDWTLEEVETKNTGGNEQSPTAEDAVPSSAPTTTEKADWKIEEVK